mmetsp:Transcript_154730/g.281297  ORF Transcript_154730/g.281297 Transcript_154730/m.281297 type:complete len:107 (+) Transcript_154730:475-795(+)
MNLFFMMRLIWGLLSKYRKCRRRNDWKRLVEMRRGFGKLGTEFRPSAAAGSQIALRQELAREGVGDHSRPPARWALRPPLQPAWSLQAPCTKDLLRTRGSGHFGCR